MASDNMNSKPDKVSNQKKQQKDSLGARRGRLIFFEALFTVYALLTLAAAVLFEFHTVYVSGGEIIFSLDMSWQVILFVLEFVTIVVQIIAIALILKKKSKKAVKAVCFSGYAAGAAAVFCIICLLFTQGFAVIPLVPFSIYAVMIGTVRMWLVPHTVKKNIK